MYPREAANIFKFNFYKVLMFIKVLQSCRCQLHYGWFHWESWQGRPLVVRSSSFSCSYQLIEWPVQPLVARRSINCFKAMKSAAHFGLGCLGSQSGFWKSCRPYFQWLLRRLGGRAGLVGSRFHRALLYCPNPCGWILLFLWPFLGMKKNKRKL